MLKCDNCNKPATVHLTEIRNGKKIEKHLCEQCAAQNEGLPVKSHTPINELLTNFVMAHSGIQKGAAEQTCDGCGITWAEFRQATESRLRVSRGRLVLRRAARRPAAYRLPAAGNPEREPPSRRGRRPAV